MKDKQAVFKARQAATLEQKVAMTKQRIKAFLEYCEEHCPESKEFEIYQSDSFGKDSTVLRHIIDSMGLGKAIPSVFSNTGLELPEIIKYGRRVRTNVIEVKPKRTFKDVWENEGIPIGSKMTAKKLRVLQSGQTERNKNMFHLYDTGITSDGRKAPSYKLANKWRHLIDNEHNLRFTDKCCDYLKKEPLDTFQKKRGFGRLDGMMADEGGKRQEKHECTIFDDNKPHSSPMLFWTQQDVADYVELHNIELCHAYYDRIFDTEGNMIACDSSFVAVPTIEQWTQINAELVDFNQAGDGSTWALHIEKASSQEFYFIEGEKRTGCSFCGFGVHLEKGANRFQKLSVSNPRLHQVIMARMGMKQALDLIDVPINFIEL